jgi:hypothetical protein
VFFTTANRHDIENSKRPPGASGSGRSMRIMVSTTVAASGAPAAPCTTTSR